MSAYLWPMSRQTVLDLNGNLVAGAWLNFWVAGTTTPLVVYQDSALSVPHPVIIQADASGRWPAVYMPYTDYRQRVRTPGGTLLFDDDGIALPAPASGGGGGAVPASQLLQTGDMLSTFASGARSGFVRLNARTIGSAGSGATERANADTEALFIWLWDRLDDGVCPVSTGRGATGAADYAAGKTLQLPPGRNRGFFGVDDMGNTAAGGFSGVIFAQGNATTPGSYGGAALHTLSAGQLPAFIPNSASSSSSTSVLAPSPFSILVGDGNNLSYTAGSTTSPRATGGVSTLPATTSTSTSVTINPSGGGAHPNMPPFLLVTHYIKL